jgi:staphylococcal nuclease domain-containing protein 1
VPIILSNINLFTFFQILSGDAIVIRGQPQGGPPPEKTVCLSNVTAPRMARRPNPNLEGSIETKDEVCILHVM